ncbi:cytochrome d ubiquinol oxidase subunit II [Streptomyces sp. NBC_00448]|uniref:cytochrome d ubiquinol oxidase subunit II n=1 Tax=Streptomyces sp. NBC_00448 TaxID=2903652 RepID=UPI002E226D7F
MTASSEAIGVGVLLVAVIAAYALFAGADFGAGIWDLLAGGTRRGTGPRAAIDASLTPVWEGNHVWLIFGLVITWTGFPQAFAAVMTALFVPLFVSLMGIVLRGVGFAFRHEARRLRFRQLAGAVFAVSSLITPFFLGTVIGAVVTGRVPARPSGNLPSAWTTPTALVTGFLFTATCAYISAIYLVGDSHRRGDPRMVTYFVRRAAAAGVVTGVLAGVNMLLMRHSATYVSDRLTGDALPLVALSVAAGAAALVLVLFRPTRIALLRVTAAIAVAAVVGGWGWAQYPYLLPTSLTLAAGSAPTAAAQAEFAVAALAALLVVPSFGYLYWLQQHGRLQEGSSASLRAAAGPGDLAVPAAEPPAPRKGGFLTGLMLTAAIVDLVRDALARRRGRRPS